VQELAQYNTNHSTTEESIEIWADKQSGPQGWEAQPDLWTYWSVIWRRRGLILGLFAVVELLTAIIVFNMTPIYSGLSSILIERQTPELLGSNSNTAQDSESESSTDSFYKTQYEILRSRSLAASVIRKMGLEHSHFLAPVQDSGQTLSSLLEALWPSPNPTHTSINGEFGVNSHVIDAYLGDLTIRPEFGTRLVEVAFSTPDPTLSAAITNAHVQAYIVMASERIAQSGEAQQRFLEKKLVELEKRIEKSESALNDYRRQRGIVVFAPDDNDKDQMSAQRISELNRVVVGAETQRIALQADAETIRAGRYDALPAVVASGLIQNLKSEASKLEGDYAHMANEYTPDWPPEAQLHAQLVQVEQREQEEVRKIVDSIRLHYESALDQENRLKSQLEAEKAKAMSLKDSSLRDVILSREVDTNRALYQNVLERIKVLGVASESGATNVSIVDKAEIPLTPSSPKKRLSLVLSGFLALLLGVAIAFGIESRDQGLKNADDVQSYLRLPNLATVRHFPTRRQKSLKAREFLALPWRKTAHPTDEKDDLNTRTVLAAIGDAYRTVRTAILLSRSGTPPKTILFSSAIAGEGKSWTVTISSIVFAQMVDRVLLIDADLRKPCCHSALNLDRSPGLTEVLTGHMELTNAIQPTNINGLYLLSAGLTPPNPTELLGSTKMREILAEAAASFQHVLIDSPAILPISDSVLLSSLADGVVVIANAQTARPLVREACSRLMYVRAKLLGVVLNDVHPQHQRYSQSYDPYQTKLAS
jgi:capsular exopolysaccharide synthesis family protein